MKNIYRSVSFGALALAAGMALTSCAGAGVTVPSPFQGTFNGPWTSTGTDVGTAQVTVTPGGAFTGTETDTTINLQGSVNGNLQNNGTFTGTTTPLGHLPITTTGQFQISTDKNTLSGTLIFNGVTYTFTLTRTNA